MRFHSLGSGALLVALAVVPAAGKPGQTQTASPATVPEPPKPPTIVVEIVVSDRRGQPLRDLRVDEVELYQAGAAQQIRSIKSAPSPGGYRPRAGIPALHPPIREAG